MISDIAKRIGAWLLKPSTERNAGWLLTCIGCLIAGIAVGTTAGADQAVVWLGLWPRGAQQINDREFKLFIGISTISCGPLFLGVLMIPHASRRERGVIASWGLEGFIGMVYRDLIAMGKTLYGVPECIRKDMEEIRRARKERQDKKAIFDAWRNR